MPRLHGSPPPRETPREEERRENFYARLFDSAQDMWDAERAEGIDDEVALLRGKFRKQVAEHPEDYEAIVKGISLLVRAVVAQYRMSPERAQDFAEKVTAVVRDLGEQMIPELFAVRGDDV